MQVELVTKCCGSQ